MELPINVNTNREHREKTQENKEAKLQKTLKTNLSANLNTRISHMRPLGLAKLPRGNISKN